MTQKKARASVDMEGDLAVAFLQELGVRVAKGFSPSKAELARVLIVEALRFRGYDVDMPDTQWGGYKIQSDEDEFDTPNPDEGNEASPEKLAPVAAR